MKEMPGPVEEGSRPSGDVHRTESLSYLGSNSIRAVPSLVTAEFKGKKQS
jgi:hypothetical protein